jgi:hypothetical protein
MRIGDPSSRDHASSSAGALTLKFHRLLTTAVNALNILQGFQILGTA